MAQVGAALCEDGQPVGKLAVGVAHLGHVLQGEGVGGGRLLVTEFAQTKRNVRRGGRRYVNMFNKCSTL